MHVHICLQSPHLVVVLHLNTESLSIAAFSVERDEFNTNEAVTNEQISDMKRQVVSQRKAAKRHTRDDSVRT